ncbi:hypothetical protein N7G274_004082 [Stereocaulon virgatum]|uniref:chitinase n=1 Tax=Stereocaulon virgatum TaxID=373712 RepID=A0ABR4AD84_9LECA
MADSIIGGLGNLPGYHGPGSFNALSDMNTAVYWGQGANQERLMYYCQDDSIDIIQIGFVNMFPDQTGGYPGTNFGNQCGDTTYSNPDGSMSPLLNHCPDIGPDIKYCQNNGKIVLLSLGGAEPTNQYLTSEQSAMDFADFLWTAFGPMDPNSQAPRPFGDARVDGFDFDIESTYPLSLDKGASRRYGTMVDRLRNKYAEDPERTYYISGAPQCVIPDAHLAEAIQTSWFDFLFVQFYNTPECSARAYFDHKYKGSNHDISYDGWVDYVQEKSLNKGAKVFLGLPAAKEASNNGNEYLSPDEADEIINHFQCKYSDQFGGVMLFDAHYSDENRHNGKTYCETVKESLRKNDLVQCSREPPLSVSRTNPFSGLFPSGVSPTGVFPSGVIPSGVFPPGVFPTGAPTGVMPSGVFPSRSGMPSGVFPSGGNMPSGVFPSRSNMPSGVFPSRSSMPSGVFPSGGTMPCGVFPSRSVMPSGVFPSRSSMPSGVFPSGGNMPSGVFPSRSNMPSGVFPSRSSMPSGVFPSGGNMPSGVFPSRSNMPSGVFPSGISMPSGIFPSGSRKPTGMSPSGSSNPSSVSMGTVSNTFSTGTNIDISNSATSSMLSTSVIYQTDIATITSCGPEVTNCPARAHTSVYAVSTITAAPQTTQDVVTTEIVTKYLTTCPVKHTVTSAGREVIQTEITTSTVTETIVSTICTKCVAPQKTVALGALGGGMHGPTEVQSVSSKGQSPGQGASSSPGSSSPGPEFPAEGVTIPGAMSHGANNVVSSPGAESPAQGASIPGAMSHGSNNVASPPGSAPQAENPTQASVQQAPGQAFTAAPASPAKNGPNVIQSTINLVPIETLTVVPVPKFPYQTAKASVSSAPFPVSGNATRPSGTASASMARGTGAMNVEAFKGAASRTSTSVLGLIVMVASVLALL